MTKEGQFKKRILELNENGMYAETEYSLSTRDVFEILDEGKKEIFKCVPIEELKGLTKDNPELVNVLLKWFGETKKENGE